MSLVHRPSRSWTRSVQEKCVYIHIYIDSISKLLCLTLIHAKVSSMRKKYGRTQSCIILFHCLLYSIAMHDVWQCFCCFITDFYGFCTGSSDGQGMSGCRRDQRLFWPMSMFDAMSTQPDARGSEPTCACRLASLKRDGHQPGKIVVFHNFVVVWFIPSYLLCSPLFKEDYHFDEHIFQRGWFNHQLDNVHCNPVQKKHPKHHAHA